MKVTNIFFSPSGTTKKVLNQIASNFDEENEICDLLYFNDTKEFGADDVVIVGMPVFAGRIPKTAAMRLLRRGKIRSIFTICGCSITLKTLTASLMSLLIRCRTAGTVTGLNTAAI